MLASFRPPSSRGLLTLSRKAILRMWKCKQTTRSLAYMSTPPSGSFNVVVRGGKPSTQLLQALVIFEYLQQQKAYWLSGGAENVEADMTRRLSSFAQ